MGRMVDFLPPITFSVEFNYLNNISQKYRDPSLKVSNHESLLKSSLYRLVVLPTTAPLAYVRPVKFIKLN